MKKILFLFGFALLAAGQPATAEDTKAEPAAPAKKLPDNKKADGKKSAPVSKSTEEYPPQPLPPTVAFGVEGKQPPAPPNKIDPNKPVSPMVPPKGAMVKGEPPGGYPKLEIPAQPKGNIDPSSIKMTTVYSYRDEKGTDLFADTLEAVPKQYRDKAKKVQR